MIVLCLNIFLMRRKTAPFIGKVIFIFWSLSFSFSPLQHLLNQIPIIINLESSNWIGFLGQMWIGKKEKKKPVVVVIRRWKYVFCFFFVFGTLHVKIDQRLMETYGGHSRIEEWRVCWSIEFRFHCLIIIIIIIICSRPDRPHYNISILCTLHSILATLLLVKR